MDYNNLKEAVKAVIKKNGNQEITGELLQAVLLSIISNVGENAGLVGQANPTTNPGSHDGPVFFVATEPGMYVNFGNKTINNFAIFYTRGDGGDWEVIEMEDKVIPPATEDTDGLLTAEQKKALDSFRISFDSETNKLLLVYTSLEDGEEKAIEVPVATQEVNGLMSSDKSKILNNFAISFDSSDTSTHTLKLVYRSLNTGEGIKINVPIATSDVNGLLSAIQKGLLDKFSIYVDFNETTGALLLKYQMLDRDAVQTITIPVASQTINGILSATQKKALDTFSISFQNILNVPVLKYTDLINGSAKTVVIPAASTTSNGLMSSADKQKLDSLSPKEELFIDMWNSACGVAGQYNRETGYYELNGLTDITYEQALKIYQATAAPYVNTYSIEIFLGSPGFRTNICPNEQYSRGAWQPMSLYSMLNGNPVEIFALTTNAQNTQYYRVNRLSSTFQNCTKLRKIINGHIRVNDITTESYLLTTFDGCVLLNFVLLFGIKVSTRFKDSPLISYESLKYLVDNAANTAAITITVHATTYSYLTGELVPTDIVGGTTEEWQQLMTDATAKQISFAKLS